MKNLKPYQKTFQIVTLKSISVSSTLNGTFTQA